MSSLWSLVLTLLVFLKAQLKLFYIFLETLDRGLYFWKLNLGFYIFLESIYGSPAKTYIHFWKVKQGFHQFSEALDHGFYIWTISAKVSISGMSQLNLLIPEPLE